MIIQNKLSDWLFLGHATSHHSHLILYSTNSRACKNTNQRNQSETFYQITAKEQEFVRRYANSYNYNAKTKPFAVCTKAMTFIPE